MTIIDIFCTKTNWAYSDRPVCGRPMWAVCSVQGHVGDCSMLLPARLRWNPTKLPAGVCYTQWMPKQQGMHQWKVPWPVPWCLRGKRGVLSDSTQCGVQMPTWLWGRRLQRLPEDHNEWVQHVYISRAWFSNPFYSIILLQWTFMSRCLCRSADICEGISVKLFGS